MTFQTPSAPAAILYSAIRTFIQKPLDWPQSRTSPGTPAPTSARLLRDAGMSERPIHYHDAEQMQTYRDRHMPLL